MIFSLTDYFKQIVGFTEKWHLNNYCINEIGLYGIILKLILETEIVLNYLFSFAVPLTRCVL